MNDREFLEALLERIPKLSSLYDKHIQDNDELLSHLLMADLTRFAVKESRNPEAQSVIAEMFEYLEEGLLTGSKEVRELIGVSFAENLRGEHVALEFLRPLMRPRLRSEVDWSCGH